MWKNWDYKIYYKIYQIIDFTINILFRYNIDHYKGLDYEIFTIFTIIYKYCICKLYY